MMTRIKCAAIIHQGIIYEGESHLDIGTKMLVDEVCTRPFPGGKHQGFVTNAGDFVNREEGMVIALASGQVIAGETFNRFDLFSEDYRCSTP